MICPSCSENLTESVKHCTHCGIAITIRSVQVARIINNCGWVARRSLGGFFAGGMGWIISMAVSRTLGFTDQASGFVQILDLFPGRTPIATAIAAAFIGSVGGMIERSAYKSFLGAALGALGGFLGGMSYPFFENFFKGQLYSYSFTMAAAWGITASFVGLTSGLLEGTRRKMSVGILGGLLGGILGGGIGSQMYGALLMELGSADKVSWMIGRLIEFIVGGVASVNIWVFIGFAEKLYIFQRRQISGASSKVCDFCQFENRLNAWYCGQCGSALQVAASREQMRVTPFSGLERLSNAFQFLSWLAATTGVITTVIVFGSFLVQNFLFALFGSLLVALIIYMISILFKAIADAIRMSLQFSEKMSKESGAR